jgi:Electron transfer DM13
MKKSLIVIVAILILAAAWFLLSPLVLDTVVDEQLPVPASGLTDSQKMEVEEIETLTPEEVEAMPEAERMEKKEMMEELGQKMPDTIADEPMDAQPTTEARGTFRDADGFHRGSGSATVYTLPDGKRILRFEDFSVTNGPALSVYLVRNADGNVDSGFLDLGKLKGNKGNQNYEIPAETDLSAYNSVVIWCVPFGVTFTVASFQ